MCSSELRRLVGVWCGGVLLSVFLLTYGNICYSSAGAYIHVFGLYNFATWTPADP